MSVYEPSTPEVWLTIAAGNLMPSIYKDYVDRLELRGDECVLDFGSGSGNPARFLAPRLLKGGRLTCVDVSDTWMNIARRRLKKYPNVVFKCGELSTLDIPDASQEVVFIHFVLHDLNPEERPRTAAALVGKLVSGGKLYVREPLQFISRQEVFDLMRQNGLEEVSSNFVEIKTQGRVYEGVYRKP